MPLIKLFTPLPALLCLLGGLLNATQVLALPSDRNATITVEADRAQINEKTGITDYQGSVIIKQGTMLIEADQVTIHSTDGQANKIICIGEPAHYQQQPNPEDGLVNAYANTIKYFLDTETITLIKNASLEQQGSTLKGDHINYDLKAELVEARGSNNSQERVHMVIPASQTSTDQQAIPEQDSNEATIAPTDTDAATEQRANPQATNAQKDSH